MSVSATHEHSQVYPCVCGGTPALCRAANIRPGLSPRVRGNRQLAQGRQHPARSIPACAGEPHNERRHSNGGRVYPRVCGGTGNIQPVFIHANGLSPRVRGNRLCPADFERRIRSIPACAGEP